MSTPLQRPIQQLTIEPESLAKATNGFWYQQKLPLQNITYLVTDSRLVQPNDAFVALKGEKFDAHDFANEVVSKGATALIVERHLPIDVPQLIVPDTRLAMGDIAKLHKSRFASLKVVALTGSSGKTTTKQMLGSILAMCAPTLVTRGNLNNDLGVPMMMLELLAEHRYAVFELGANHIGEILYTSQLVEPQVAGILNIGTAHVGEFGGRKGIAIAKSEIFRGLKKDGIAILPQSGDFVDVITQHAQNFQKITFGQHGDIFATDIILGNRKTVFTLHTPIGEAHITLPFVGIHNVDNALSAVAFALALNIPLSNIVEGLANAESAKGRLNIEHHGRYTLIDDTYNANPHAMIAGASVLMLHEGIKVMVTGDIAELGDASAIEHEKVGKEIAQLGVDYLFSVGEYAQNIVSGFESQLNSHEQTQQKRAKAFHDKQALLEELKGCVETNSVISILFKGSRSATMETVLQDLKVQMGWGA